jgi:hypothetical protein
MFILEGMLERDIGIVNIYAPNDSNKRAQLWEALIETLPLACRWILI